MEGVRYFQKENQSAKEGTEQKLKSSNCLLIVYFNSKLGQAV